VLSPSAYGSTEYRLVPADVTGLLRRWGGGDAAALTELMPIVYEELRRLARSALRRDRRESILQPTALVNEAWLRLAGKRELSIDRRAQFYGLASKLMRDILVDQARRRRAAKRGGSRVEVTLEHAHVAEDPAFVDLLALDEAMTRLGTIKPRYTQIVELRCLGGLTIDETAAALRVSHATIEREWSFARAWLRRELERDHA
jgi:RNA polymerase sigma factor (TIGR02999 family)